MMATYDRQQSKTPERKRQEREKQVREQWEKNGNIYVDKEAFDECWADIQNWISIPSLVGYGMRYGLVNGPEDNDSIVSPYFPLSQRKANLLSLASNCGVYGYFILYMCIHDSITENQHGHGDAVLKLEECAKRLSKLPPFVADKGRGEADTGPAEQLQPYIPPPLHTCPPSHSHSLPQGLPPSQTIPYPYRPSLHRDSTTQPLPHLNEPAPSDHSMIIDDKQEVLQETKVGEGASASRVRSISNNAELKKTVAVKDSVSDSVPFEVKPAISNTVAIARENQQQIKREFVKLQMLVSEKLQTMQINMQRFLYFIKGLFHCDNFIPASKKIDDIFEAITRNGLWDFINYSPLRQIANAFARDDEEINAGLHKYRCALAGYLAGTKIVDHIASMSPISEEVLKGIKSPHSRTNQSYFHKLTFKLEARVSEESLDYLIELWDSVSDYLGLPSLTYLLDEIHEGCISVTWLIPPTAMPAIVLKIEDPETAKFFSRLKIVRIEVDDLFLYEEKELSVEAATEQKQEQFLDFQEIVQREASQDVTKETMEQEQESLCKELSQQEKDESESIEEQQKLSQETTVASLTRENLKLRDELAKVRSKHNQAREEAQRLIQLLNSERELKQSTEELEKVSKTAKDPSIEHFAQKETSQDIAKESAEEEQDSSSKEFHHDKEEHGWSEQFQALQETVRVERKIRTRTEEENGVLRSAIAYNEVEIGQLREKVIGLAYKLSQTQEETHHLRNQLQQSGKQELKQTSEEQESSKDSSLEHFSDSQKQVEKEVSLDYTKEVAEPEQDYSSKEQLQQKTVESVEKSIQARKVERARADTGRYLMSRKSILNKPDPKICRAVGHGLYFGETNQTAHFQVHLTDANGEPCVEIQEVRAELKSLVDGSVTQAEVSCQSRSVGCYEVSYQPSIRGRHKLSVTVNRTSIAGSPFKVYVQQPPQLMDRPVRVITELSGPRRATVSTSGQLIVTEDGSLSLFDYQGDLMQRIDSVELEDSRMKLDPSGIVVDDSGIMYVCDVNSHKLFKIHSSGKVLKSVGGKGSDSGQFDWPDGIALRHNQLYVCGVNNHRVQIFSCDLNFVDSIGNIGSGDGELRDPRDVAFDQDGNMYVAEWGNDRVQVFSSSGTFLRTFGKHGCGPGELSIPLGIQVDHNIVYIAELGNHRVSAFTTLGEFITSFGRQGSDEGEFGGPGGITMDQDGFLYLCDYNGSGRIQIF